MFHSCFGHLVKDILSYVSSFHTFSFSFTLKQGNAIEYTLAWRKRFSFLLLVWIKYIPPDINNVVHANLSIIHDTLILNFKVKKKTFDQNSNCNLT